MSTEKQRSHAILKPAIPKTALDETPCAACEVRQFAVCGALTPTELDQFGNAMATIYVDAGAPLVDEGEDDNFIYSITSGSLKCFKLLPDGRRQITGFMFPGDFLGLAKSPTYINSVEAITPATLCRMSRKDLGRYADNISNLDRRLHEMASEALADVQDQILMLGRKTSEERVATFLLSLSRRAGERGGTINPVEIPMSRDDIGDFLGLTTETVSRTFSRLRKRGLIGQDKERRTEILDFESLREISEGF